ncbi:MAG: YdcF family protein [Planctomycetes bacterium]|nr:YdcF family protein [Planctomycetota bacterium]MCB9886345.1 YdcF family protein [Planctomycetota bacterium]
MKNDGGDKVKPRRWRRRLVAALVFAGAVAAAMHEHVRWSAAAHVVAAQDAPQADFLVVPGARIHADGKPFHVLQDRLETARELFARGVAPRILVSGRGGGGIAVDEVAAMRRWLQARGVPAAAIVDDGEGLRTIDTMHRCKDVFGARSAVVVTNPFHVDRAVFLGRQHGLEVTGVAAPPGVTYGAAMMLRNRGREVVARIWAWLEVFVIG